MTFIPTEKIASGTITNLILYLAIIGALLFVATILRLKVLFLKKAFIPASLIAGIIGLILGPYVLKVFPADMRSSFSAMPTPLIVIVFACMMLGRKSNMSKEALVSSAPSIVQCYTYSFVQVALTCLLVGLIFTPLWGTNPLFGSVIEIGFEGGHGTAGGMSEVFKELGWEAGTSVSQTTATIGLLAGVFGGVILINIGVKKKWTNKTARLRDGFYPCQCHAYRSCRRHGSKVSGKKRCVYSADDWSRCHRPGTSGSRLLRKRH